MCLFLPTHRKTESTLQLLASISLLCQKCLEENKLVRNNEFELKIIRTMYCFTISTPKHATLEHKDIKFIPAASLQTLLLLLFFFCLLLRYDERCKSLKCSLPKALTLGEEEAYGLFYYWETFFFQRICLRMAKLVDCRLLFLSPVYKVVLKCFEVHFILLQVVICQIQLKVT